MNGLKTVFEALGSLIAYRFSLLPRWARASFWALARAGVLVFVMVVTIFIVVWIIQTFSVEAFIITIFFSVLFLVCLKTVWGDIPEGKRKNEDKL